ncbi:MAG: hypothetical protein JSS32_04210 [Verrucomicrobia bacterium]|nr:hypothetical protein [Verrucomicrobiota bacterium]
MKKTRLFQVLALFGTALFLIAAILIFRHSSTIKVGQIFDSNLLVQNTYLGPTSPVPGNPLLIRVEITLNDDPQLAGLEIESAQFNGTSIPLNPKAAVNGYRGKASFQLPPGQYKLTWRVNRSKKYWPRSITHEEIVTLDPRDQWVQVIVIGEEASIH